LFEFFVIIVITVLY